MVLPVNPLASLPAIMQEIMHTTHGAHCQKCKEKLVPANLEEKYAVMHYATGPMRLYRCPICKEGQYKEER
jgi:uncharacterized protein with PIN domain